MSLQIIKNDERLEFEYLGGTFFYRRPMIKEKRRWTNECTNARGVTDFYGVIEKAIPACLIGWENGAVIDDDNKPVSYSENAALSLPEDFYLELAGKLGLAQPEGSNEELEAKNSSNTSSSK